MKVEKLLDTDGNHVVVRGRGWHLFMAPGLEVDQTFRCDGQLWVVCSVETNAKGPTGCVGAVPVVDG